MVRCRSGGCKRTPKREARGRQGFQRCPSVLASGRPEGARGSSGVPQSWQAGGQRAPGVPAVSLSPGKRESRGRSPLAGGWGCPPEFSIFSPLPRRKGARGMVRATIEAKPRIAGVQRGAALAGVWGCPPVHISTPLPIPPSPYSITASAAKQSGGLASGSPEGAALWQGSGVSTSSYQYFSSHPGIPPTSSLRAQRSNPGGWQAGVQRDAALWQGSGCPPAVLVRPGTWVTVRPGT